MATVQHTVVGVDAPTEAPPSVGAHYTNSTNGDQYLSAGTASVEDWKLLAQASQLPAPAELVPAGGTDGQVLTKAGGAPAWATPAGGGSGGGGAITRANMVEAITGGALGMSFPEIYALPGIGAMILCQNDMASAAPWLTETAVNYSSSVGGVFFRPGTEGGAAGIKRGTGGLAGSVCASIAGAGSMRVSTDAVLQGVDPAEILDGSFVELNIRLGDLSSGANPYYAEISLSIPPFDIIRFGCGDGYGSTWELYWIDDVGGEHTIPTSVSASTAFTHALRIEKSGSGMLVKIDGTTITTIPLAELAPASTFGMSAYIDKYSGSAELLVGIRSVAGHLALAP